MKVLVMSDTHGYIANARRAIEKNPDIELIIHLGDYCRDVTQLIQLYPDKKFEYVYGNCDIGIGSIPAEKTIEIEGKKIFMTHGHKYSVKWDHNRIMSRAQAVNAEVILYGHTHISSIEYVNNFTVVNPGSMTESRSGMSESYAVLDITKEIVYADLFYI
jgi:putative phosphoesterase